MQNSIKICIIDDKLPFRKGNIDVDDERLISKDTISQIVKSNLDWGEEQDLESLLKLIVRSRYYDTENVILSWALRPGICINQIKSENYSPDLIIYDWEFVGQSFDSADELMSLLEICGAFFFVYSNQTSRIPIQIFKKKLDSYAKRFQLLPKGEHQLILSSEELIFEYITMFIDDKPSFKIGKEEIHFDKSKHLKDYKDILYLEHIIGKQTLKKELSKHANELNDETVYKMLDEFNYNIFLSEDKNILFSDDTDFYRKNFGPLTKISYADVFSNYGLTTLMEVLDNGILKVKI